MVQSLLALNADWHISKVGIICFVVGDSSLSVVFFIVIPNLFRDLSGYSDLAREMLKQVQHDLAIELYKYRDYY